ncbi:transmembrane protease serine 11D-like [Leptodactylus fuscus]
MALMAEAAENDGDRQLLHKKSRTVCCGCCASCCSCCIHCLSGFIFLLTIAGLVLCARIFLEFPVIINGFRSTMNVTKETIDELSSDSQGSGSNQPSSTKTCKVFVGSFELINETYLPQYNDTSSADFQRTAQRLQNMMNTTLKNSLLNVSYRNASVFLLSPDPTTAHFQLLFCNDNSTVSGITADNIVQILKNYSASKENINISVNVNSLAIGGNVNQKAIARPPGCHVNPLELKSMNLDAVITIDPAGIAPCPAFFNSSQSWPWRVVLQGNQKTLCTGSLLSSFWILSSASCVKDWQLIDLGGHVTTEANQWKGHRCNNQRLLAKEDSRAAGPDRARGTSEHQDRDPASLTISLGDGRSSLTVDTIIQHPNFTSSPVLSNFALIRLSRPAWFTSFITPICLPQTSQDPAIGSVCGSMVWKDLSGSLSGLTGTMTSGTTCLQKSEYGTLYLQPSLSNFSYNQTDPGIALVCMKADGTAYLQGILSSSSLSTSPCLSFTSIGQTIGWVSSYIIN